MIGTLMDVVYIGLAFVGVLILTCVSVKLTNENKRFKSKSRKNVKNIEDYNYNQEEI